jgi:hypothetical protein
LLTGHQWSYRFSARHNEVARCCGRCLNGSTGDMFPAIRLDKRPTSDVPALAVAYDLVAAIAADDITGANQALRNTSAVQVAVVAIVLAKGPPISNLRSMLRLLAIQAEIDAIDITEEGSDR